MRLNTTRDFYIPQNSTKVEAINGGDISSGRNEDYMPDIDNFTDKTMTATIRSCCSNQVYLKCESWYSITSWDGKPEYQTNIMWR